MCVLKSAQVTQHMLSTQKTYTMPLVNKVEKKLLGSNLECDLRHACLWVCECVCDCVSVCVCVHMWASVFVLALYWNTTGWLEFPLQALGVARFEPHICAPALSLLPSLSTPLSFSLWEACILRVLCYFKGRSGYVVHRVYAVQIIYLALSRSLSKQDWVTLKTLYIYVRFYQSFFCILYWPTFCYGYRNQKGQIMESFHESVFSMWVLLLNMYSIIWGL